MDADGQLNQSSDVVFNGVQGPSGSSLITLRSNPCLPPPHCLTQQVLCVIRQCSSHCDTCGCCLGAGRQCGDQQHHRDRYRSPGGPTNNSLLWLLSPPSIFPLAPDDYFHNTEALVDLAGGVWQQYGNTTLVATHGVSGTSVALSIALFAHGTLYSSFSVSSIPGDCRGQVRSRLFLEPMVSAWDQQHQCDVTVESDCRWGSVHAC